MASLQTFPRQQAFLIPLEPNSEADANVNYGAVFTQRWVADFILDLVGFSSERDLAGMRLIEPACGDGAFLLPIAERVIASCRLHGKSLSEADGAVRAYDLQLEHVHTSRKLLTATFKKAGLGDEDAARLAAAWVIHDDFLLSPLDEETADFVVGNPPYIRLEGMSADRSAAYRQRCVTMSGRADIYLGFFEMGLRLLAKGGVLGFICADRWMRNAYGQRLRHFVAANYAMEAVVEMHDVDAFADEVAAYPAVTIIRRADQAFPVVATTTADFGADSARRLVEWMKAHAEPGEEETWDAGTRVTRLSGWFGGESSWPTGSPERLSLLRELEERFQPLETSATRIGIGVATGADGVFVTKDGCAVEPDRLVPLAMTKDTASGTFEWGGYFLVNPWAAPRELVSLDDYPELRGYLESNAAALRNRHVAGKRPAQWYRTIDPVHGWLIPRRKLLFPDMKMFAHPVLDLGGYYPHHNLYYVISDEWELEVLGGLLLSRVAQFFIEAYAVRMRGGTLRFQAQYLRRIRVPRPSELSGELQASLAQAFVARDVESATDLALKAYGLEHLPD